MKKVLLSFNTGCILFFIFSLNVVFGQTKTYVGSNGNWNTASNWSPSGVPSATDAVVIPDGTVTISSNVTVKSISVTGTLNINTAIQFTVNNDFTINSGGTFNMPSGSDLATLVVYGNYFNNGATNFWKSTVVIAGNLDSPSTSVIQKQGNVVVGGNIVGKFDTTGGNGSGQIYAVNPNATVTITPSSIDANVVPGVQVTSPETQTLIDLVNSVIYGTSCSFSCSANNVSACSGSSSIFSITTTASSPTYQWQVNKNDGTGWNNLTNNTTYAGVTAVNLTVTNVSVAMNNYKYRARVTSGGCSKYSNYGVLTVSTTTTSTTGSVTGGSTICSGSTSALLTLSGSTGTVLRWESSISPFSSWNTIANTSTTYTSGALNQTTQFRAVVQNGVCSTATSSATTVTIAATNTVGAASTTPTLCINTLLTAITHSTTGATGIGTPIGLPTGVSASWSANKITINGTPTVSGTFNYTIPLTGGCGSVSATGTIVVNPNVTASVSIVSNDANNTICSGTSVTFTATPVNGGASPSYQWKLNGANVGTNSATYTTTSLPNNAQVNVVMTSNANCVSGSPATSNTITTVVNPNVTASVSIVSNDADNTICSGTSVTFTATPVNGGASPSYQWKLNGANVGTNSATYTTTSLPNNAQVNVVMTSNANCVSGLPATSNTITTVVNPNVIASVSIVSNDADNTICSGTSVTFTATPVNGGASPSYQWKLNGANVGTNSATYTTTSLSNNAQVNVVMTSNANCVSGSPATSNTITTLVSPASVAGTVSSNQTITTGGIPSNISLTGSVGAIQWQSSTNNVNFTNINGATSATLLGTSIGSLSATTYFRALVSSGVCTLATSGTVTVTVQSDFQVGTVSTNQSICYGTLPSDISVVGSVGSIQWQSSVDNITFTNIVGANSAILSGATIGALSRTTYFKCIITRGQSNTGTAGTVTVTVGNSTIWNGTSWSNGVPTSLSAATISGNYNVATNINACSLTVNNNAIVIIPSGYTVALNTALTVENGSSFTLENNANLIQEGTTNTNSGAIVVKRNSSQLMRQDYTLWSSPVANQNVLSFSPNTLTNRFYGYDSKTNFYTSIVPSTTVFTPGKGFLIRVPNTHPYTPTVWTGKFTGVPNSGDYTYNMYYDVVSQPTQKFIYNLVGNPYPSPISMSRFVADNSDVITGTLYFWRETNGNTNNNSYCAWSGGTFISNYESQVVDPKGIIQTGQGFFVEAKSASPLVFKNSQREANTSNQFFRMAGNTEERNTIWLNATSASGAFSQMAVGYISGATQGVDLFDGKSFGGGPIALSSILEDTNYVIQGRALPFDDSDVVPLGFKAKTAGDYTIAIDHVIGLFSANQDIFLKDNLTNTTQNLKLGSYTFSSDAGSFNSRFTLVFKNQSLAVDNFVSNSNVGIVFTNNDNMITIQNNDLDSRVLTVSLYNLVGQVINTWDVQNENQQKMQVQVRDLSIGTYLVKVKTTKGDATKKILVKNTKLTVTPKKIDKELPKERSVLADED